MILLFFVYFVLAPGVKASGTYQNTGFISKGVVGGLTSILNAFNRVDKQFERRYQKNRVSPSEVFQGIRDDFKNGYLFSGAIDSEIYAEDCVFTDPTLSFRGLSTFERNIAAIQPLLDKFIGDTTVVLYSLKKDEENNQVKAVWRMSGEITSLPWNPRIELRGNTRYTYDAIENNGRIVDYFERWELNAGEALAQLLVPGKKTISNQKVAKPKTNLSIDVESTRTKLLSTIRRSVKDRNKVRNDSELKLINENIDTLKTVYSLGLACSPDELIGTEWRLAYTNSTGASSGTTGLLVGSEVSQRFGSGGELSNSVFLLSRNFLEIRITGVISSVSKDNAKIKLAFEDLSVFLGGKVPIFTQKSKAEGYWKVMYQDENLRIFTTNAGSIFVLEKIEK
jgi:hypothetical protein